MFLHYSEHTNLFWLNPTSQSCCRRAPNEYFEIAVSDDDVDDNDDDDDSDDDDDDEDDDDDSDDDDDDEDDDGVTCRAKVPSTTLQKMGFL